MVYEADAAGTLIEILAEEGDTLPIGEVIARVGEAGEAPAAAAGAGAPTAGRAPSESPRAAADAREPPSPPPSPRPPPPSRADARCRAEPAAGRATGGRRRRAGQGVSARPADRQRERASIWRRCRAPGPGGRIVKADVEQARRGRAAGARRAAAAGARRRRRPGAREQPETAKGAGRGRRADQAPADGRPADGRVEGDRAALLPAGRDRHDRRLSRRGRGSRPPPPRATSCRRSTTWSSRRARSRCASSRAPTAPTATASCELYSRVNVGVAVAAQDALVVPTVFDADLKGLRQIATETRALAARVRDGTITPPELSGGTFTVSNLGMYGISNFHAVINPPQAAILAVGAITEKPGGPRRRDRRPRS